jgi:hypothetical protein
LLMSSVGKLWTLKISQWLPVLDLLNPMENESQSQGRLLITILTCFLPISCAVTSSRSKFCLLLVPVLSLTGIWSSGKNSRSESVSITAKALCYMTSNIKTVPKHGHCFTEWPWLRWRSHTAIHARLTMSNA